MEAINAKDVLPNSLEWLQQAEPVKCYSGHEMQWTDVTTTGNIYTGDVVGLMDPTTCREVQQAAGLWKDWMLSMARRTGTVVKTDVLSQKDEKVVEIKFDVPTSRVGAFSAKCLRRQLRVGDMVQTTRKIENVEKGATGILHTYSAATGGTASFGASSVKVQASSITCQSQKWRCGAPQCSGGHATAGMWRWCCFTCGLNLCCVCRVAPPRPLRKLFSSKLPVPLFPKLRPLMGPSDITYLPGLQDWVILTAAKPKYGLGNALLSDVGVVVGVDGDECSVKFSAFSGLWRAVRTELQVLRVPQKVVMKDGVAPSHGWGDLSPRMKVYGAVRHIEPDGSCFVLWDGWSVLWSGHLNELHVVTLCAGDAVVLRDETPSFGRGNVAVGEVGFVTSINEVVTVRFAVQPNWKGLLSDLQRVGVGSVVSIHAGATPREGWQGVSAGDVGRVCGLGKGGACEVSFPSGTWVGNMIELEVVNMTDLVPREAKGGPMGPPLPAPKKIDHKKLSQLSLPKSSTDTAEDAFKAAREKLKKVYTAWDTSAGYHGTYNNLYRWVMLQFAQLSAGNEVVLSEEGRAFITKAWDGLAKDEAGVVVAVDEAEPWFACVRTPSGAIIPHLRCHIRLKE